MDDQLVVANRKSSSQMEEFLNENFHRFSKPSTLYGQETNTVTKSWDDMMLKILRSNKLMRKTKRKNWAEMSDRQKIAAIGGSAGALARRKQKRQQEKKKDM